MDAEFPTSVRITTQPTFWELYLASLQNIRHLGWCIIVYAIFPGFGLFLLATPLMGYRLGPEEILLAIACFLFVPILPALAIWSARRQSKLSQGPITYSFNAEGMEYSGADFDSKIRWPGIVRIRQSKRFLLIFVSPMRFHCIPLRSFINPDELGHIRRIASGQTDFR